MIHTRIILINFFFFINLGNATIIPWNSDLYGSNSSGLYARNVDCPYGYLGSCTYNISSTCSGTPVIVQCREGKSSLVFLYI